jgi:hypothetical protein
VAFHQHADDEGDDGGENERDPEIHAPLDHLPAQVSAEHRHLALGEIEMIGRYENHHQR